MCRSTKNLCLQGQDCKVVRILKGSLDSIPPPSPSVKIQIMCGKVCLSCKSKTLLCFQKFVDNAQQYFAFTPQANFPPHDLNITEGKGDEIESRLPFKIFSTLLLFKHAMILSPYGFFHSDSRITSIKLGFAIS